ncbi:signal peptidase II Aspartic peptidase. MEROPS family A08 [Agreia bicolorata]|uniref:Lipoprotein signal peptidase n=1 Tax=Agreia bicolorata TaxID=110935 RepID=A0A1T4YBU9_9MICO|nr:signal peptidase II [Agreia bicolorata]SKA99190.1 signal peptidase II Aspartic peptidase. MEROPS family A08 [Agreia bicolorata]
MEARTAAKASPRVLIVLVLVAIAAFILDQGSKYLVVTTLKPDEVVPVLGDLLQFQFVKNPGAAFSIGNAYTWIFSILASAVTVFIVWFARRIRSLGWAIVFGLLLGGVLGNLTDRLFREPGFGVGHVIDFLRIPLLPAIFNIADTAIVVSMGLFLILTLRGIGLDGSRPVRTGDGESDELQESSATSPGETS